VVSFTPRPLFPREKPPVPIVEEVGWTPEPVWKGKSTYSEKTCHSAALSTTNPTYYEDANLGRHDGKPATNGLSYGTAVGQVFSEYFGPHANLHFAKFSIVIIIRDRYSRSIWWPTCRVDPVGLHFHYSN
jgi:hypothetical protein